MGERLVQPRDGDAVRPRKVTHSRVAASLCHPNHRLVVLMAYKLKLVREKGVPKGETW